MLSENSETKEIGESTKDISDLKDEVKVKSIKSVSKQSKNKDKSNNKSLLLYKNDIKIKKPKYYGKTKSILFVGETPIFILTESSKNYYNHLI